MLQIKTILLPQDAGLLSAYGIGQARVERFAEQQVLASLESFKTNIDDQFDAIATQALAALKAEGFDEKQLEIRQKLIFLRFFGQDSSLEIPYNEGEDIIEIFNNKYQKP